MFVVEYGIWLVYFTVGCVYFLRFTLLVGISFSLVSFFDVVVESNTLNNFYATTNSDSVFSRLYLL